MFPATLTQWGSNWHNEWHKQVGSLGCLSHHLHRWLCGGRGRQEVGRPHQVSERLQQGHYLIDWLPQLRTNKSYFNVVCFWCLFFYLGYIIQTSPTSFKWIREKTLPSHIKSQINHIEGGEAQWVPQSFGECWWGGHHRCFALHGWDNSGTKQALLFRLGPAEGKDVGKEGWVYQKISIMGCWRNMFSSCFLFSLFATVMAIIQPWFPWRWVQCRHLELGWICPRFAAHRTSSCAGVWSPLLSFSFYVVICCY